MQDLRSFLEERGFYRIPLKKLKTGHYKFKAFINNLPGGFILDTGASTSCMGFVSIEKFKLDIQKSKVKAAGAGAINMETYLSLKNKLHIKNHHFHHIDMVVFDMSHVTEALQQADEEPVDGIFGADFLKKTRSVIDYGRNCFYVK
ncbi:MAG: retropepsin-like aspartic protease family protein [Flavobacteriales bacterium]